ncbi:hypothetical protein LSAT2_030345, partial [Lamellibrachia satsuma]
KTYYCFGPTDKYSTKGLSKRHNDIDKNAFLEVLTNRRSGSGKNRGFRVRHSTVLTYVQERAALTYFYAKRVSDRVRISKYKGKFEKGYAANWSEELFTIHEVHPSDPPVYRLRDDLGEVLEGTFYEMELQKV